MPLEAHIATWKEAVAKAEAFGEQCRQEAEVASKRVDHDGRADRGRRQSARRVRRLSGAAMVATHSALRRLTAAREINVEKYVRWLSVVGAHWRHGRLPRELLPVPAGRAFSSTCSCEGLPGFGNSLASDRCCLREWR